jgi:hypothetical protein
VLDFPLNTTVAGDQIAPALSGSSQLVAAWASFGQDGSSFGAFAQRLGVAVEPCVADATTLCLNGDRFRIRATFATAAGAGGPAQAVALTADSGYYWFFDDANVEIVVKIVDACGLAGFDNFWVFATGLWVSCGELSMETPCTVSRRAEQRLCWKLYGTPRLRVKKQASDGTHRNAHAAGLPNLSEPPGHECGEGDALASQPHRPGRHSKIPVSAAVRCGHLTHRG